MNTAELSKYLKIGTNVISELSTILSLYVDPASADNKTDALSKSIVLFTSFGIDVAEATKIASYIVDVVEVVAGGTTAAADVLKDITTTAAEHGLTLPPVIISMLSGLLVQGELAIQELRAGK